MSSPSPRLRIAVVGGGIFGVSSAVHLARMGADVMLVTENAPASGASGRSLAWINSARFRSAEYHRLRTIGIDRYRTLAARYPDAAWLRFDGGITWDANDASNKIAQVHAHEGDIGYQSHLLAPEQVAAVTPGIDVRAITPQGAIFNPGEGWVDLPSLIEVLLAEYSALGGRMLANVGPASVETAGGRVKGVVVPGGSRITADAVLLAVGPAVPKIVAQVGKHIPDATPVSLLLQSKPLHHKLRAVLNTPRVAVRPTPTGALVFDSGWSEEEVINRGDGTYGVKDSTIRGLLAEVSAVLEGNPTPELDSYGVGPKPIPGDGEPVFGELDEVGGYYVAFSHSGATLGLIAGELLAGEIMTGRPHPLLKSFRPGRFTE